MEGYGFLLKLYYISALLFGKMQPFLHKCKKGCTVCLEIYC